MNISHEFTWRIRAGLLPILLACGFSALFSARYDAAVAETQAGQSSSSQLIVPGKPEQGPTAMEKKLHLLDSMLTGNLNERVASSNNDSAKRNIREVRQMYHNARQSLQRGDSMLSEQWIAKAFLLLSKASREVKDAGRISEVNRREYERSLERAHSFMRSYDQLMSEDENKQGGPEVLNRERYQSMLGEASLYASRKDFSQATHTISKALELIEIALVKAQASQTLIGSLDFNDPEVSYQYEKDRNESNRRLLAIIIRQYEDDSSETERLKLINGMRTRADELRAQAELSARSGDHESAGRIMESSTRSLVQAQHLSGFKLGQ